MGMSYTVHLMAGVAAKMEYFQTGTRTRYDQNTGEPEEVPIRDIRYRTASGTVFPHFVAKMTSSEIDDWMCPEPGDFAEVGKASETHVAGVLITTITPYHESTAETRPENIATAMRAASNWLASHGITDEVRLLMVTEVS